MDEDNPWKPNDHSSKYISDLRGPGNNNRVKNNNSVLRPPYQRAPQNVTAGQ